MPEERPIAEPRPRRNLVGLGRDALAAELSGLGAEAFRVRQVWHWIYHRGATEFAQMTSLAKAFRQQLCERYELARPAVVKSLLSGDGTRKWLLRFADDQEVETVHIPEEDRGTLCVSSQVGCTLNCTFCHTGTQRLVRNLTAGEIVGQIMVARDRLGDWPGLSLPPLRLSPTLPSPACGGGLGRGREGRGEVAIVPTDGGRFVTNIVMMGMGEPLYNFEAVRDALLVVADNEGIAISKRKITVSTSGVVPNIKRTGEEIGVMLAVSLHAVRNELRNALVPLNRKYPIEALLDACRSYPGLTNARRITFEYVMLKGINDSLSDAKALVRLLAGIPAKINLIPFNPWPGARYECSDWETIEKFSEVVFNAGYSAPVRTPRGRDILAACGQLKSATEKLSARERMALRAMAMTE